MHIQFVVWLLYNVHRHIIPICVDIYNNIGFQIFGQCAQRDLENNIILTNKTNLVISSEQQGALKPHWLFHRENKGERSKSKVKVNNI